MHPAATLRTLVLTACLASSTLVAATETTDAPEDPAPVYWQGHRDGWFWYRDPPPLQSKPRNSPQPVSKPPELRDFEAMQQRLDELKRIAVMNPSDANLLAYMRYQRQVMERSERFAERWQHLVWTTPELDYALTGRPTNTVAIAAYDEQARDRQHRTIRSLAGTHGLLFIFRGDCPYCHRLAPILKRFEQDFGMTVFPVSLDGAGLPEYPNPQRDNGIAARLNANVVPALYLTAPANREIQPIGFGVMALNELVERIAALAPKRVDPL